jgi:RNA-directed DNA polymerase
VKRLGSLWPQAIAFENLLLAYRRARLGKRRRGEVARFELELERNLLALRDALDDDSYRPGRYRRFHIYDRKPRLISAAPFRDRVVQHALMAPLEPLLDRTFIDDSYACRTGRGVHKAVRRYQGWARRYGYVLQVDISRYFPSIDHARLKAKLRRRIKDRRVLGLFDRMIDQVPLPPDAPILFPGDDLVDLMQRPVGLPIGNLTSQFLANLYLDDLDHYLKENLRVRAYLRYVDDLILLDDDRRRLWELRDAIAAFLQHERLLLHPTKQQVYRAIDGVDVLGYRVFPDRIRLRRDSGYRFRRRLRGHARAYAAGRMELSDVTASVKAWVGHAQQAATLGLRKAVLGSVSFRRASDQTVRPACGARRWLEQQPQEPPLSQPQQEQPR